ncbi:energy transducer TonB [Janthinobacterium sp. LB2P49]|uniref:energy transducer TonB n=1 Tax=Janthinobacterium sp. LB2P49 TaxID=3424198 RepID=UPI003F28293D
MRHAITILATTVLLSACQNASPPAGRMPLPVERTPPGTPAAIQLAASIDAYKSLVAQQIMAANGEYTFSGRLPPMLPAIVVLDLSVGPDGELKSVHVHRSRDSEASAAALAAVRRVPAFFPPAGHLMRSHARTFDFSETFLFNDQYRFQLRSLSGPQ